MLVGLSLITYRSVNLEKRFPVRTTFPSRGWEGKKKTARRLRRLATPPPGEVLPYPQPPHAITLIKACGGRKNLGKLRGEGLRCAPASATFLNDVVDVGSTSKHLRKKEKHQLW